MSNTYRPIPVNVTAMAVPDPNTTSATAEDVHDVAAWCGGEVFIVLSPEQGPVRAICLPGAEAIAKPGDFIVITASGAEVVTADVFPARYEPVAP